MKVKEEVQKQLRVGFIRVAHYHQWVAIIILVPMKDGRVRICMDFRDLNKKSLKDDFSLPHMDILVDNMTGHALLSIMDTYADCDQVKTAVEDMKRLPSLLHEQLIVTL